MRQTLHFTVLGNGERNWANGFRKEMLWPELWKMARIQIDITEQGGHFLNLGDPFVSFFFLFCILATPVACGNSWARDWTCTIAVTQAIRGSARSLTHRATKELLVNCVLLQLLWWEMAYPGNPNLFFLNRWFVFDEFLPNSYFLW